MTSVKKQVDDVADDLRAMANELYLKLFQRGTEDALLRDIMQKLRTFAGRLEEIAESKEEPNEKAEKD